MQTDSQWALANVVRVDARGRRRYREPFKQELIRRCLEPGASVSRLSIEAGVNTNLLRRWIQLAQRAEAAARASDAFLPVVMGESAAPAPAPPPQRPAAAAARSRSVKLRHRDRTDQRRTRAHRRVGQHRAACRRDRSASVSAALAVAQNCRVWVAAGVTDMRRGMDGLAALVQTAMGAAPFSGDVFVFRGRRGDLIKVLWWSGDGMNLYAKRLERGRFIWPAAERGVVHLTAAQLSMLLEGIDWRRPARTWQPQMAV